MVTYALRENTLKGSPEGYIAVVNTLGVATLDDIIGQMITEGSGLSRPQAMAYFEKLAQSVEYFINLGFTVSTPLFRLRTSISGTFNNKDDSFDPARHQINVRASSGVRLNKLEKELSAVKTRLNRLFPSPEILSDTSTGTDNAQITGGGIAILRGSLLKFDPLDTQQGIFFAAVDNPAEEIRVKNYGLIRAKEVHFQIPPLEPKNYVLSVKSSHYAVSSVRKGEMEYMLTVKS